MLAYCDYIADVIQKALKKASTEPEDIILFVDKIKMDLHPEKGYFLSTKKTIRVVDTGEKAYRVTVEEI